MDGDNGNGTAQSNEPDPAIQQSDEQTRDGSDSNAPAEHAITHEAADNLTAAEQEWGGSWGSLTMKRPT